VITPPSAPPGISRHHRQQPLPLLISQIMPIQAIIHSPWSTPARTEDLQDTP